MCADVALARWTHRDGKWDRTSVRHVPKSQPFQAFWLQSDDDLPSGHPLKKKKKNKKW